MQAFLRRNACKAVFDNMFLITLDKFLFQNTTAGAKIFAPAVVIIIAVIIIR